MEITSSPFLEKQQTSRVHLNNDAEQQLAENGCILQSFVLDTIANNRARVHFVSRIVTKLALLFQK